MSRFVVDERHPCFCIESVARRFPGPEMQAHEVRHRGEGIAIMVDALDEVRSTMKTERRVLDMVFAGLACLQVAAASMILLNRESRLAR